MNKTETKLVARIETLVDDIRNYISKNPNWIFYFLNPLVNSEANKPIEKCVKLHPNDWEDYITFDIRSLYTSSVEIEIRIDDGTEEGINLNRHIYLPSFEETVCRNKKLWDGKLDEIRIETLTSEIERLKEVLEKKESELNELKKPL